jgi:hypothetical protein
MIISQGITAAYAADVPVRGERSLMSVGATSAAALFATGNSCNGTLSYD